jgi:CheY-like chemotaxis protein
VNLPRVLIVDDNEMNRDMLSKRLQRRGFQVDTARDGLEALDMIAVERYEIVLLDLVMPGADGFEVLRRLRGVHSAAILPVIIATSSDRSDEMAHARQLGANDYLVKPFDFDVLTEKINAQLAFRPRAAKSPSRPTNESPPIAATASGRGAAVDTDDVKAVGRSSIGPYSRANEAPVSRVFICHSSADRIFLAREIIPLLQSHGLETWYSNDDIRTASEWERSIRKGLMECDWFLVALSPRAVASTWVRSEVHWAAESRWGRIVPIMLEPCDPIDVHLKLAQLQCVDFTAATDSARGKLLAAWGMAYEPATRSAGPTER